MNWGIWNVLFIKENLLSFICVLKQDMWLVKELRKFKDLICG